MSTVGDVGYVDDDGFLYLTDRSTFMIISGGVNIYPQECENLLITHPKVADAAVFGVPNDDLGEEVKAVVQPMPGVEAGADDRGRADRVLRRAPRAHKCPRSIDFVAELPRLPTGKLYKRGAARPLLEGSLQPDCLMILTRCSRAAKRDECGVRPSPDWQGWIVGIGNNCECRSSTLST